MPVWILQQERSSIAVSYTHLDVYKRQALCCMYRSIFIDLDDTVLAFTENARDTFQDMYDKYHFDRYFRSFSHFYTLYSGNNEELWNEYGAGRITKDEMCIRDSSYAACLLYRMRRRG